VHVRYPDAGAGAGLACWHHLHYHGRENIAELVSSWRRELKQVATGEMKSWLTANLEQQFDYAVFFYGTGEYARPEAVPRGRIKTYARRWYVAERAAETRNRPAAEPDYRELVDRLTMVAGAAQPGYASAASRIMRARSIVASADGRPPEPVDDRFLEGYRHPITVYLHGMDGGPADDLEGPLYPAVVRMRSTAAQRNAPTRRAMTE
jgi:hypothetical protein